MELWVRSQDKETLLKVNKIKYEHYKPFLYDYYIEAIILNNEIVQEYKTKERALEVLDEIQEYINNKCQQYISKGDYYTSKYEYRVYQMPEE